MALGVLIDGLYSVEYAINNLAIPASTQPTGTKIQQYAPRQIIQAKIEERPVAAIKKTGVRIDFYDPELIALLGGEL